MSDFVPHDLLPDLWEEILQRHWTFLETEENMQKLEEKKQLEGCLKDFLCIVPHDRKFFLPETSHVLRRSIKDMDDFSAYNAMIGFESISQYASNLFTKPWRKEYRLIKMYSGFYQHEIKSNLIDADKLFEAMGYKQLPNQILMLEGPICPDQVTNVSRDAMAAYVECQIMKQIYSGLKSLQLSCSWSEIFSYRENHIGGASQGIKSLAYSIQERRFRKEKLNSESCYSSVQSMPQSGVAPCPGCVHQYQSQNSCNHQQLSQQQQQAQSQYGSGICSLHAPQSQSIYMQNNSTHHYKSSNFVPPQMSHSKSLEHYNEHSNQSGILPHRHSFDQPYDGGRTHYDAAYDCVDGYQSCNFNAYNHPYNVSGNRYPLPYNISNQLNNQFPGSSAGHYPPVGSAGHYPPPVPPAPTIASCGHKMQMNDPNYYSKLQSDQLYVECNGYSKKAPQPDICNYHTSNSKDLSNYRQCSYGTSNNSSGNRNGTVRTEQLIDFDDRPGDVSNVHHNHNRPHTNSFDYDRNYNSGLNRQYKFKTNSAQQHTTHYDIPRSHLNIVPNQTPKDLYSKNIDNTDDMDGNYLYASCRSEKKVPRKQVMDKYVRNADIVEQYEKHIDNNEQMSRGTRDSYDSFEEIDRTGVGEINDKSKLKSVSNKNQDGMGSFELWDYVFQKLEKNCYSKDLGERGDLFVQGLDLDSSNINSTGEKRRSRNLDTKLRTSNDAVKSKTLEKTDLTKDGSSNRSRTSDKSILKHDNGDVIQKPITKSIAPVQKAATHQVTKLSSTKTIANNNQEQNYLPAEKLTTTRRPLNKDRSLTNSVGVGVGVGAVSKTAHTSNGSAGNVSTVISSTSTNTNDLVVPVNKWSCRFCTYFNPDTKRICEVCCRSKDFVLETTNSPTCV